MVHKNMMITVLEIDKFSSLPLLFLVQEECCGVYHTSYKKALEGRNKRV